MGKSFIKSKIDNLDWMNDRNALIALSTELDELRFESVTDSATKAKELLDIANLSDNIEAQALMMVHLGDSLRHQNNYNESARLCLRAVKLVESFPASFTLARALNSLGSVQGALGFNHDAIQNSLLAMQLAEKGGYEQLATRSCITLTYLYCLVQQYETAIEYCQKVNVELCDSAMRTVQCINWSEALESLGRLDEALDITEKGLLLAEKTDDKKFFALLLNNKACIYVSQNRDSDAAILTARAEKLCEENGYYPHIPTPSRDAGFTYFKRGRFKEAIDLLERSLALAKLHVPDTFQLEINEKLAESYFKVGRSEEAYQLLKVNHSWVRDTYHNQIIESSASSVNAQLEWMRKENQLLLDLNAEAEKVNRGVEEANRRRIELLANISHEIRTPMNGVIGLSNKLLNSSLTEDQFATVNTILKCGKHLIGIVDELLTFTEIENGTLRITPTHFGLREFLSEIEDVFQPQALEKNISFSFAIDLDLNNEVWADSARIRQVVFNLVSNAIKFTQQGQIQVVVERTSARTEPQRIKCSVIDSGKGMNESMVEAIRLGDNSVYSLNSRKYGGNGLGLIISRRIINALSGTFGVESQVGRGSTLWFEIPLPEHSIRKTGTAIFNDAIASGSNKPLNDIHILVAEDNDINWMVIESLLDRLGATHMRACDGLEAVRLDKVHRFDVVLMDCHMPKMNGFEASALIRKQEEITHQRKLILALSADVTEVNKRQCAEFGMDGFLTKPIVIRDVLDQFSKFRTIQHR